MIATPSAPIRDRPTYQFLDADSVLSYLRSLGSFDQLLGGVPAQWRARECGDGNLNLVFVVQGPSGALVVKQALPYVRMVGDSWPLSIRRNFFEHAALQEQARWAAQLVPQVYHADEAMALIVMQFLTPHSVLRAGFINGKIYPSVGEHLGLFLARTLFNTSELRLPGRAKKERIGLFLGNTAMCQISEDVIFDEPYFSAPLNRHTSPQLDKTAFALARDTPLKVAVQSMKRRFMNQPECLIHGDLHTGSVMVTQYDTRVIDPEFAFYGPMGFDFGTLLANFLMAYLAQPGHAERFGARDDYRSYLLNQIAAIWKSFASEFSRLWLEDACRAQGELCNPRLSLDSPTFSAQALAARLKQIWDDALGFAGCEMIRRIVGLAHIADFESIVDQNLRAECEYGAIVLGRTLLLEPSRFGCISELVGRVHAYENEPILSDASHSN